MSMPRGWARTPRCASSSSQHDLTPFPDRAAVIRQNGFQVPVEWMAPSGVAAKRTRLRVRFEGTRKSGIRLHAIYLTR